MEILEDNAAVRVLGKIFEERGIEKGIKEGIKEGAEKTAKETAISMMQKGFDKSLISEIIKKPVSWVEDVVLNQ